MQNDLKNLIEFSKTLKILYVEDDETVAKHTLKLFDRFFDDITVSINGKDGLEEFKKSNNTIDIVITDINMPIMNGIEMLKEIKGINKNVHCIILSAHNETSYFTDSIKIGVDGYILKPIEKNQFLDTLYKIINNIKFEQDSIRYKKDLESQVLELKTAIEAKSSFLANMSHEIRTPLNAILGFVNILKESIKNKENKKYLTIIDNSSNHLLGVIDDILDFTKIENGKLKIESIDFNVKKEFQSTIGLFSAKASESNISLKINIDKDLPKYLNGDALRIKQIISNLLSNAIKFTNNGKNIYLDISYKNNILNVSVKDEGIGISKDKAKAIFEAFSQADNSTTRRYGGTGLGLSISIKLISLMDGELKLKSEVGIGSEFYFNLPLQIGNKIKKSSNQNNNQTFNGNILVVEDNKANQMFMKVLLKKMNLKFDIVNDGLEALEQFKINKYNIIFMDENMPNMNGIEATKQILEIENIYQLLHTPIIALTANSLKGDRERFLENGMDEYLAKPINKDKLIEMLVKFLK